MENLKQHNLLKELKTEVISPKKELNNIHEMFLNIKREGTPLSTNSDIPKKERKLSDEFSDSDLRNENDDLLDDDADFLDDALDSKFGDPNSVGGRKEPHLVARRNARERRRVQMVNEGFSLLRRQIPTEPKHKKLSKVNITNQILLQVQILIKA